MGDTTLLVYGANGYTGKLAAARAKERGLTTVVAGRSRDAIDAVASELGLPGRVFGLDRPEEIAEGLSGIHTVLHCAGPYSKTSRPMVEGCLAAGAHYLDITGEYAVLEAVLRQDAAARARGIALLPAVGFDVVPTDCMAKKLADALPGASSLELAFSGGMKPSPGTAKTAVEGLHLGARVRRGGEIVELAAPLTRTVPFGEREQFCMSIPWGDLVTAFHSTGIPNITVYTVMPRSAARLAPMLRFAAPLLRAPAVVSFLQRKVEKRARGPSSEQRDAVRMWIWGRAARDNGESMEGHLEVPEGYELTVRASVECARRVMAGEVSPGASTPSRAFGADFVTSLPGVGQFRLLEGTPP